MYGKVFDSIYDGTLYGHWEAIVTMQQLIVLASPDGVVDMTPQSMSARTSIPLDILTKGLKTLSEPDPFTRTPGEDGRRIVLMDDHRPWGWRLVNHGKYMRLRDMEQKREADRERIAVKRNKIKDVAIVSRDVAEIAYSDSDLHTDLKENIGASLSLVAPNPLQEILPSNIPYKELIALFNEHMTGLPKVRDQTPKRRALIRSAWNASKKRQTMKFWKSYFEECSEDPFLNGTGPYGKGHENWQPSFDYLLKNDVVTRTYEKAMQRAEA